MDTRLKTMKHVLEQRGVLQKPVPRPPTIMPETPFQQQLVPEVGRMLARREVRMGPDGVQVGADLPMDS